MGKRKEVAAENTRKYKIPVYLSDRITSYAEDSTNTRVKQIASMFFWFKCFINVSVKVAAG